MKDKTASMTVAVRFKIIYRTKRELAAAKAYVRRNPSSGDAACAGPYGCFQVRAVRSNP